MTDSFYQHVWLFSLGIIPSEDIIMMIYIKQILKIQLLTHHVLPVLCCPVLIYLLTSPVFVYPHFFVSIISSKNSRIALFEKVFVDAFEISLLNIVMNCWKIICVMLIFFCNVNVYDHISQTESFCFSFLFGTQGK